MFKIIEALHVTPTERKIIAYMIENGCMSAASKRISATMEWLGERRYRVTFKKTETDDWGRPVVRKSFATIEETR